MKWVKYIALFCVVLCCNLAHAGQVILTMPDEQIKGVIEDSCLWGIPGVWDHCEKPENNGYKTDTEKMTWMLSKLLAISSRGHYQALSELQASIEVRYDR